MRLISVCCAIFEWDTIPVFLGLPIFLANGFTAFALNIATVYLIKNTSALVLALGGIIKDILLIAISTTALPESHVAPTQMFGYSAAGAAVRGARRLRRWRGDGGGSDGFGGGGGDGGGGRRRDRRRPRRRLWP
jgi:uncharacterized membrane protein YgcG